MPPSVSPFWTLLQKSGLFSPPEIEEFRAKAPVDAVTPDAIANWLHKQQLLTPFQAKTLAAGRPGPFVIGNYRVLDLVTSGRFASWFRVSHSLTKAQGLMGLAPASAGRGPHGEDPVLARAEQLAQIRHANFLGAQDALVVGPYRVAAIDDPSVTSLPSIETLEDLWKTQRRKEGGVSVELIQMISALNALHSSRIVHGDIGPWNVVVLNSSSLSQLGSSPGAGTWKLFCDPWSMLSASAPGLPAWRQAYRPNSFAGPSLTHDRFALGTLMLHMLSGCDPATRVDAAGTLMSKLDPFLARAISQLTTPGQSEPQLGDLVRVLAGKLVGERPTPAPAASLPNISVAPKVSPPSAPPQAFDTFEATSVSPLAKDFPTAPHSTGALERFRKTQKRQRVRWWAGLALVAMALSGFGLYQAGLFGRVDSTENSATSQNPAKTTENSTDKLADKDEPSSPTPTQTTFSPKRPPNVSGDNEDASLLWESPTSGKPHELRFTPPDAQMILALRPADWAKTPEAPRVLQSLGPVWNERIQWLEAILKAKWTTFESLRISFHSADGEYPKIAIIARPSTPISVEEWRTKLGSASPVENLPRPAFKSGEYAYCPEPAEGDPSVLIAPESLLREALESPEPVLRREAEMLRRASDETRHLTLFFNPGFLQNDDGRPILAGSMVDIPSVLEWVYGADPRAALLSLHGDDFLYGELRLVAKVERSAILNREFRTRVGEFPSRVTEYLAERLDPPVYWRKLAFRAPQMLDAIKANTRIGNEGDILIANVALPSAAEHNLALLTDLTLSSAPAARVAVNPSGQGPKTLADAMKATIPQFSFDQQTFEFAVRDLSVEVRERLAGVPFEFDIQILGKDLELNGITRNQTIRDFRVDGKPVGEILTSLLKRADARLVWAISVDPENASKTVVLVTTRDGAQKRNLDLPEVYRGNP